MQNNHDKELYPYNFRTQEEVLKELQRKFAATFENIVFLRPHHLRGWFEIHYYGYDKSKETYDPEKYFHRARKNHFFCAENEVEALLSGEESPNNLGFELIYLNILKDSNQQELSDRDRETLNNLQLSEEYFDELARLTVKLYQDIWNKPDSTPIVMTRVLDDQCYLLSKDACAHCYLPFDNNRNTDEYVLEAVEMIKNGDEVFDDIDQELIDQIQITYVPDTEIIQSVIFPLVLLRSYNFVLSIQHVAGKISYKVERELKRKN